MDSNNVTWQIGNSLLLDCVAPKDFATPSAPVAIQASGGVVTVQGHLNSAKIKGIQTVDVAISGTTATMTTAEGANFTNGAAILIEESDQTFARHTIDSVPTAGVFTFTPGLAVGMKVGARIWKTYGAGVRTGALYGTPDNVATDWGYVVELPFDYYEVLRRMQELEAMVTLDQAGTNAHWTKIWQIIMSEPYGNP